MKSTEVNSDFIRKIRPVKVVIVSFLIWALLFFTAPLEVKIDLNVTAYVLMALSMFAFIFACYLPTQNWVIGRLSADRMKSAVTVILIIAFIGLLFKMTDRFLIRGLSVGLGNMMNRELMSTGSGNFLGIIGATLSPFGYIPLFLVWKYKLKLWFVLKWCVYILFVMQIIDAFILGSRSSIIVNFTFLILNLIYFRKVIFKPYMYILFGLLLGGFAVGMNYIFIQRSKEILGDKVQTLILNESGFNYTATASDAFKKELKTTSGIEESIGLTYIISAQYLTHGMLEFSYLYSNYEHEYKKGAVTFGMYARLVDKILPVEISAGEPEEYMPRYGVYTTMLGPLFVDFGWLLIVFMFVFGRIVKSIYQMAINGSDWATLFYFYLFLILAFWPVFNFINGAGGLYTITSFLLFGILSKYMYNEKRE